MKRLIINADDFGFTRDVNAGIVHAHCHGVLTSTTLMATGDAFDDAVKLARETPSLDIGCHLVLVQGRSLISGRPFPERPRGTALAVLAGRLDPYSELRAQIEKIVGSGLCPTHLDSHKHVHLLPKVFKAMVRLAHEFAIPFVRLPLDATYPDLPLALPRRYYHGLASRYKVRIPDHFLGVRLTGALDEAALHAALSGLREGTTEFMCHPGFLGPELTSAATRLKDSRVRELEALTSPRIRALLNESGVRLGPFDAAVLR